MTAPDQPVVVKDARGRILMESSVLEDVKQWVQEHFPRHHNEPGNVVQHAPDALVYEPDGTQHAYLGGKWTEDVAYKREDGRFTPEDTAPSATAKTTTPATKSGK